MRKRKAGKEGWRLVRVSTYTAGACAKDRQNLRSVFQLFLETVFFLTGFSLGVHFHSRPTAYQPFLVLVFPKQVLVVAKLTVT